MFSDLYDGPMPLYLTDALKSIKDTYFIGIINDQSLAGAKSADSLDDVAESSSWWKVRWHVCFCL